MHGLATLADIGYMQKIEGNIFSSKHIGRSVLDVDFLALSSTGRYSIVVPFPF